MRIPYDSRTYLFPSDSLLVRKRGGGERLIPAGKWWLNKDTPVGDEAELWERMPHEGRRLVEFTNIVAVERPE